MFRGKHRAARVEQSLIRDIDGKIARITYIELTRQGLIIVPSAGRFSLYYLALQLMVARSFL